jgi:hypothetical protein
MCNDRSSAPSEPITLIKYLYLLRSFALRVFLNLADKTYPAHVRDKLWEILQLKENGWKESSDTAERAAIKSSKTTTGTQKSQTEKVPIAVQTKLSKSSVKTNSSSDAVQSSAKSSSAGEGVRGSAARSKSSTRSKTGDEQPKLPGRKST